MLFMFTRKEEKEERIEGKRDQGRGLMQEAEYLPPPTCLLTDSHVKPRCYLIKEKGLHWYFWELAIVHPSFCVMH